MFVKRKERNVCFCIFTVCHLEEKDQTVDFSKRCKKTKNMQEKDDKLDFSRNINKTNSKMYAYCDLKKSELIAPFAAKTFPC